KNKAAYSKALKTEVKLNIGCGDRPLKGFLNVDRRDLPGVDIVAEADDIPCPPGRVTHLNSTHLVEYVPKDALLQDVLPTWFGLLSPDGLLTITAVDQEAALDAG